MNYRQLGKTGLMVSEIGLGGEWLERHTTEEVKQVIDRCEEAGINILDCWMSEPNVRSNIGKALAGKREKWYIQGHVGSTWQNGQYVRTRDLTQVNAAFEDLLTRLQTDYIDLGMIHFVDEPAEFHRVMEGDFFRYMKELKADGRIRHIGLSTHNPEVGKLAAECGEIEMFLFSVNPAFDMLPATENIDDYFADSYDESLSGIAPERAQLYRLCEQNQVGITVMKGYAGGRLFNAGTSPFGAALTPVQCLHYALTRPAVASVMVGFDTVEHVDAAVAYETASMEEKDYASVLAGAPRHGYYGQCTYCGHCAPCPAGIDIAMVNKLCDLALMQDKLPDTLKAHYSQLTANADACVSCHSCESRCPFGVRIAERMEKTKALFG
ncbi:aldo/keto reductase [Acetatifactor muris]|uniref:General stress protein 69 n=1 Tax=Acetatifactor muris TaxID=879566 RepID=A0A2K4ZC66_9FIRM|nr:aldo/keto reductase [Acetatifactor muris]MCI8799336.1 aldo/keto reductase [Lachnospiraceae bacterium]MCR2046377.1 aldo/keto reductase [Acetatifactor muris]SOY28056.1 General stress protein 69 [Acetatifactor muris]